VIYAFHKIGNAFSGDPWWVRTDNFKVFIETLLKQGEFVYLEDYLNNNRCGHVITFDDGYKCILDNAVPILKANNIPFEVFVTFGYVGKDNSFDKVNYQPPRIFTPTEFLAYDDLFSIIEAGGRIQHHTWAHTNLTYLNEAALIREFENPIGFSSEHCRYISYPYGAFDRTVISTAKLKFSGGVAVRFGSNDRFELLRKEIGDIDIMVVDQSGANKITSDAEKQKSPKRKSNISSTGRQVDCRWPRTRPQ
jgi:peptidoglycan/xylan/chitin deacetylase (PgdA/CDA1 family)